MTRTSVRKCCNPIKDDIHAKFDELYPEKTAMIDECIYKLQKKIVRNWLYEGKRVDGRGIDDIRPLRPR